MNGRETLVRRRAFTRRNRPVFQLGNRSAEHDQSPIQGHRVPSESQSASSARFSAPE
jgi:hypothetical protein